MNENENRNSEQSEGIEEPKKKSRLTRLTRPTRRTQSQALQQALGITPDDLKGIEGKLAIIKFLDYFSET